MAHVKGIVRNYTPGQAHIPAGMKATLHVQGPRGRVVLEQAVTLSDLGSFDADIQLPNEVKPALRGHGLSTFTVVTKLRRFRRVDPQLLQEKQERRRERAGEIRG